MGPETNALNDSVYIQLSCNDFIWHHIRLVTSNFQSRQPLSAGLLNLLRLHGNRQGLS
jgi:hypothetical protein